jgi:hypothetical protein
MTVHEGEHLVRGPAGLLRNADVSVSLDRRLEDFASHAENAPILLAISDTAWGSPAARGADFRSVLYNESPRHWRGASHLPFNYRVPWWTLVGGRLPRARRDFHFSLPITIPAPFRASLLLPLSSTISWSRNSTEIPRSIGLEPV